jgi:hypothetical protein
VSRWRATPPRAGLPCGGRTGASRPRRRSALPMRIRLAVSAKLVRYNVSYWVKFTRGARRWEGSDCRCAIASCPFSPLPCGH